jgi:hypothetical protein
MGYIPVKRYPRHNVAMQNLHVRDGPGQPVVFGRPLQADRFKPREIA